MDRSPPESSRPERFFRCRDAGETLSRMKIRSSLILGVTLQFGSITFAQDHKIEVTGDYSCIHANPQNNNLIPIPGQVRRFSCRNPRTPRASQSARLPPQGTWTPPTVSSRGRLPQPFLERLPLKPSPALSCRDGRNQAGAPGASE
jgi:hypothetical protein